MSYPYLPLYTDALLGDIRVQSLSGPERAYWILLLVYLWQAEGRIKDDPALLARLLQCTVEQWQALRQTYISVSLLKVGENGIMNRRIDVELCKVEAISNKRRESAKLMHENKQKRKRKQ